MDPFYAGTGTGGAPGWDPGACGGGGSGADGGGPDGGGERLRWLLEERVAAVPEDAAAGASNYGGHAPYAGPAAPSGANLALALAHHGPPPPAPAATASAAAAGAPSAEALAALQPLLAAAVDAAARGAAQGAAVAAEGQVFQRQLFYDTVHRRLTQHLRSGTEPARKWPAKQALEVRHQMVFAAAGIKLSGLGNLGGPGGSTVHKAAPADVGPAGSSGGGGGAGGGGGGGSGGEGGGGGGLSRVGAGGLLLEVKGFLGKGNPVWPPGTHVSRFYLAADGALPEQEAAQMLPEPTTVIPATYRHRGLRVWFAPKVSLVVVEPGVGVAGVGVAGVGASGTGVAGVGASGVGASGVGGPGAEGGPGGPSLSSSGMIL
ncbi:hypothetical protein HYH03_014640 [Edaphochlamys debaryana]|uniref:Uncharacterized protein n=1 Tax=Edaphochlamys debaryana TaxID=47281 RepID=A0A835XNP8_9CHLO|nr:hypothetical protein HYH03_014640 [Edaphochlamys debaryana]|eukprot:KAG2486712.1 hypothetical protein HYH03_014640 [Edaphochlamys debaryana]